MTSLQMGELGTALPVNALVHGGTIAHDVFKVAFPVSVLGVRQPAPSVSTDYGFLVIFEGGQAARTVESLLAPRTSYGRVVDTEPRDLAASLRRIQSRTGLDWGQLARTLGVSRRTVYNWLAGCRVNGVNAARIAVLYRAVTQELQGRPSAAESRSFLLTPQSDGQTPLSRITLTLRREHPHESLAMRPVELLRPASSPFGRPMVGSPVEDIDAVDI